MAKQVEINLPKYKKDILQQQSQMRTFLKELNNAQIDPSVVGSGSMRSMRKSVNGKSKDVIFFSSIDAKHRKIDYVTSLLGEIDVVLASGKVTTVSAWKSLLCLAGPSLDPRQDQAVGIVRNAHVVKRYNNEYAAQVDGRMSVVVTEEGTPLATLDSKIASFIGFVADIETVETSKGSVDIALILQIPDAKLGHVLLGDKHQSASSETSKGNAKPAGSSPKDSSAPSQGLTAVEQELFGSGSKATNDEGYREWNDRTGKFSVVAKLISSTDAQVTLKTKDGRVIPVEIKKLSDADQRYIDKN